LWLTACIPNLLGRTVKDLVWWSWRKPRK